jgi:hypothetical protein
MDLWMNLDYLYKLPPQQLLAQQFSLTAPVEREEYLIYANTKAVNRNTEKTLQGSQCRKVVKGERHTLLSYYMDEDANIFLQRPHLPPKKANQYRYNTKRCPWRSLSAV